MTLKLNIISTFKQNRYPALFLQLVALTLYFGYWYIPEVSAQFSNLSALKTNYGLWYSAVATALFGAILPGIYRSLLVKSEPFSIRKLLFLTVQWALLGCFVDYLYFWQSVWFGNGNDWFTLVKKTSVDQFVVSAFISCPIITLCYLWHDNNFDFTATKKELGRPVFIQHIPATVITNWLIWIPAVTTIYSMPLALQLPFFNLVLCLFSLIVTSLNRQS